MTIKDTGELFDENGAIPVWGHTSGSGKLYYTFQLTNKDRYILFPMHQQNPRAPKFILKKTDAEKKNQEE